jgi:hypothetical protein
MYGKRKRYIKIHFVVDINTKILYISDICCISPKMGFGYIEQGFRLSTWLWLGSIPPPSLFMISLKREVVE